MRQHSFYLSISVVLLILFSSAAHAAVSDSETETTESRQIDKVDPSDNDKDLLDWQKEQVETQAQHAAQWVDSFFMDSDYEAEIASSQFRFRPELSYQDRQGTELDARISLKLHLPNLSRKVSLVIGSESDDMSLGDSVDDRTEESVIGLQFFGKIRSQWHTSMSAGVKFDEFAVYIGPRARYRKHISDQTSYRFSQTVRWQTNNRWQILSRLDFNHAFGDSYMFRQTLDGRWRAEKSDEEGYRTRASSFLTKRLRNSAGLQGEFTTIIHTRPDTHVESFALAVRYRKRSSRDWLYYEIVPQVSFEHEFDYKANPGIGFRLEFFYGTDIEQHTWKQEPEDTEGFRW